MRIRQILIILVLFSAISISRGQIILTRKWPGMCWNASFMTGGGKAGGFRHFILLPDGKLQWFGPGEKPAPFTAIDHVVAISAGNNHMLALKEDGTVWAWGDNDERQLGNEALAKNEKRSEFPVNVSNLRNVIAISALRYNSYALLSDGTVWAWGYGNQGMTGDGEKITNFISGHWSGRSIPVQVKGIHNAIAIAGPMALLADGTIMAWGDGNDGRLGNGTFSTTSVPVKVTGITRAIAISCRESGALALQADGTVWSWGTNYKGQMGNGTVNGGEHDGKISVPVKVHGIANAVAVDANSVCMALLKDGTVKIWGYGTFGGMGTGKPGPDGVNSIPMTLPKVEQAVAIKAGNSFGFALEKDGTLMGWGVLMLPLNVDHPAWTPVKMGKLDIH